MARHEATPVELDGTGGGYGKYAGISLGEIESKFKACEAQPSMRSVSALLRIAREQLEARGQLGVYPRLATIAAAATLGSLAAWPIAPERFQSLLLRASMVAGFLTLILAIGVASLWRTRRANLHQERAIRQMAVASLRVILAAEPPLKPLTREQRDTVRELAAKARARDLLRLLDD
jgi:hypothetical protein